ncbi:pseudouridine synthase [Salinarimonas rosea]|uniref:pseudouridine synthase n=1 Tax=Salinarimonas rosea TaxID=552063 RepID=UPI00041F45ED
MANTTDDTRKPRSDRGRNSERGARGGAGARGDARAGEPSGAGPRREGRPAGKPFAGKGAGKGAAGKSFAGKGAAGKSYAGKGSAGKSFAGKGFAGKSFAANGAEPRRRQDGEGSRAPDYRARAERDERPARPAREGAERPARFARDGEARPPRAPRPDGGPPRKPAFGKPAGFGKSPGFGNSAGFGKPAGFGKKPGFGGKPAFGNRPAARSAPSRLAPQVAREEERIAKAIARAGVASRRDAEEMIAAGRVTLDGVVLTSPAVNVKPGADIRIDGDRLPERERTRLWLYHKPRGLVTTAKDPEGRPTVFQGLPEDMPRVVTIGRLDINTEGLLLLTNDGGLARVVAHPETGWLRRYRVRAYGQVGQDRLDALRQGVVVDGMEYGPIEAKIDRSQGDNVWITMGLREGKNREVKRVLEELGLQVNRLIRLSFGPFQLGDLKEGAVEEVRTKVLKEQLGAALAQAAGVDFESPVREPVEERAPERAPRGARPVSRLQQERDRARFAEPGAARGRNPAGERPARDARPDRDARPGRDGKPGRDERPARGGKPGFGSKPGFGGKPGFGERSAAGARPGRGGADRPAPEKRPFWDKPRSSVWRAEESAGDDRRPKARRGGETAKAERAAGGERLRERVGKIAGKAGRVLVERVKGSGGEGSGTGGGGRKPSGGKKKG